MEDYLEATIALIDEKKVARVKDISKYMNVSTPSVSSALAILENDGLVLHEKYGYVELSPEGERIARYIQKKHKTLKRFLELILRIDPEIADRDACEIEHAVSTDTFQKLLKFIQFVETCPENEIPEWLENFYQYISTGERRRCNKKE